NPLPPTSTLFPYTTLFRSKHTKIQDRTDFNRHVIFRDHVLRRYFERDGAEVDADLPLEYRNNEDHAGTAVLGQAAESEHHGALRSEEHTSELQSRFDLVCR